MGTVKDFEQAQARFQAVTREDVQRVAKAYFPRSGKNVLITQRAAAPKAPEGPVDPDLAALPEPVRARLKAQLDTMMKLDAPALKEQLAALEARLGSMPPQARPTVEYLMKKGRERLQKLEAK